MHAPDLTKWINEDKGQARKEASLFPVVGIGASAGGLEAFTSLLQHLPGDTGMGFVYVQHLDPHHESLLTTLLSKATAMPVHEAGDGMAVEPNHIYIIPPNANLGLVGGKLTLMPREEGSEPHMSVDYFLRSLADDRRDRAIGVILSGTASDGTLGLQAIKGEGGLTFAQDPNLAKYDGMPRSAMRANAADFVLPVEQIAKELTRIGRHPFLSFRRVREEEPSFAEHDDNLAKVFLMLRMATGVDFTHYKPTTIKRRIVRRMVLNKIDEISHYARYLKNNAAEVDALYQDLLINVTSFFRDGDTLEALKAKVFPRLAKDADPNVPLRLWVPGCASGEEAYSLAIALLESLGEAAANIPIQIFATDISESALERARAGVYSDNTVAGVSRERLRRFFVKLEGGYQIKKSIRDMCLFARQDLSRDPPFSKLDLISCRNVLIYLNGTLQKKIIPTFHYALNPSGILVLGISETIGAFADLFSLLDKKNKIYAKKADATRPLLEFVGPSAQTLAASAPRSNGPELREPDAKKEADRIMLKKYSPASVLVNEQLDILQFRGSTGDYLEPAAGAASLNLLKMTREGLMLELRGAMQRAKKQNSAVEHSGIRYRMNGRDTSVRLEITPIKPPGARERYFLVTFESATGSAPARRVKVDRHRARGEARRIVQLEQELAATSEYLQSTIETQEATNEELRSALEEIQSANEELQSVNEELETAKEELQSTNEELTTVNEELQNRNAELALANNDLSNLLASVHIPVVMLDEDMRIRRFTPMAERIMNLIPNDIGRPLADLGVNFLIPELQKVIHEVTETLTPREFELKTREGRWYSARVRPYKTLDNRIEGVVLALLDVSTIKSNLLTAQDSRDYAQAIVDTVRQPLLVLDGDLRVQSANRAYYDMFQTTAGAVENRSLFNIGDGWHDNAQLRELLEQLLPRQGRVDGFEIDGEFSSVGQKHFFVNATRIERESGKVQLILLAIEDRSPRTETARP